MSGLLARREVVGPRPRRGGSLTVRLGWRLALLTLLAALLAGAAMAWRAIETVHEIDDTALQAQAGLIAARLPQAVGGEIVLPDDLVRPFRASDGDNLFLVYDGARVAATSDAGAAGGLAGRLPQQPGFFRLPRSAGHRHGMIGLVTRAGPWRVVVLQGREQTAVLLESLTGSFIMGALWLVLPIGLAMTGVAVLTLRRGLRPLREVSEAAALVGPARPGARLPLQSLPREIMPIVHAVNDALDRLERALLAQRHFLGEAAHAMRTPLAVLMARLDLLDDAPDIVALRHDTERLSRLVGQLLQMERLAGLPLDLSQRVELRAVAVEAIASLVPLGLRAGLDIGLEEQAGQLCVWGNKAALVLATTNLIENALAHAPAGSEVVVTIAQPATIAVLDRGPGVAPEQRARIFRRFERGPQPRAGGVGLGLAIVAEIAAAHGGSVEVGDRPGGGAEFALKLRLDYQLRKERRAMGSAPSSPARCLIPGFDSAVFSREWSKHYGPGSPWRHHNDSGNPSSDTA